MRTTPFRLIALAALASMTAACVGLRAPDPVPPPRLSILPATEKPCLLDVLPPAPTQADLEAAYMARGAAILNCDGARQLALETLLTERRLIDAWLEMQKPRRSFWPF